MTEEPARLEFDFEGFKKALKVTVRLSIQKTDDEYFCQGEVSGIAEMECARCLGTFQVELSGPIDFILRSQEEQAGQSDVLDDEDYAYFERNELRSDITELVRQALILAAPMKPICDEACRGLCPGCGANLNEKTCTCAAGKTDPRWDELKRLLDRSQQ